MRKLFSLFLALVATTSLWAYNFKSGDLYYNITSGSAPCTVEVSYAEESITSAVIPSTVTYNGTTYSVTSIGLYAFCGCSSLTSVTIGNSVTSIGDNAFAYCSSLTSITIPNSVTSVGSVAFSNCSSLTSVTIGNSVTSIGYEAFGDCSSLTSITIPNSVTSIGDNAFSNCSSLTKTNYTGDIAGWCNIKFGDPYTNPIYYSQNFYINDQEVKDLVIPNTVDSIHNYAFYYCSSLTSVTIPNSVTIIGAQAFSDCYGLTSVTIGDSVTIIGTQAFYKCSSLTFIKSLAEIPPTLGYNTFYNVSTQIPVYVLCSSVSAYQSAEGWKDFTNIQCMPEDESAVDNVHSQSTNCQKILRDGQLIILRDGVEYNAMGQEL